jgi:CheY-like chemotaxis protein
VAELKMRPERGALPSSGEVADMSAEEKLAEPVVLLGIARTRTSAAVCEALQAERICARPLGSMDAVPISIAKNGPALAILEHNPPGIDGIELCRAIRRQAPEHQLPVLIVADREDQDAGAMAGVSDWLIEPFTAAYARTKIRTWLLRTARKSIKSAIHAEEERPSHPLRVVHAAHGLGGHGIKNLPRVSQRAADGNDPVISSEKAALLWMYGRQIAAFDTPTFSNKVGEIIAQASKAQTSSRYR